jgi:hypothetical protein
MVLGRDQEASISCQLADWVLRGTRDLEESKLGPGCWLMAPRGIGDILGSRTEM